MSFSLVSGTLPNDLQPKFFLYFVLSLSISLFCHYFQALSSPIYIFTCIVPVSYHYFFYIFCRWHVLWILSQEMNDTALCASIIILFTLSCVGDLSFVIIVVLNFSIKGSQPLQIKALYKFFLIWYSNEKTPAKCNEKTKKKLKN